MNATLFTFLFLSGDFSFPFRHIHQNTFGISKNIQQITKNKKMRTYGVVPSWIWWFHRYGILQQVTFRRLLHKFSQVIFALTISCNNLLLFFFFFTIREHSNWILTIFTLQRIVLYFVGQWVFGDLERNTLRRLAWTSCYKVGLNLTTFFLKVKFLRCEIKFFFLWFLLNLNLTAFLSFDGYYF